MSDVFHKEYKPLTDDQKNLVAKIKDTAQELYNLYDSMLEIETGNDSRARECARAKTDLETSVMWAVKGITK